MSDYTKLIPDFGLSVSELRDKYEDSEHPILTAWEWRTHVNIGNTRSGYWEWVHHKLGMAQDELDRDNPYNQPWSES